MQHSTRFSISVLTTIGCALLAGQAQASGFSTARFGGEHGHPMTTNPTAVYYNPAGIAKSEGFHLFIDTSLAIRSASYTHSAARTDLPEPDDATGANTDEAELFNVLAVPMLGASAKFGDFALGAGYYVPFGGTSIWEKNEKFKNNPTYPGPYDGANRWYSLNGTISSTYYTLAAAYHIPDTGLHIGLSGNLIRSVVDTIRARNADGSNDVALEGRSYADVSGWQVGFGAGVLYDVLPQMLTLGVSYQSRPNVSGGMILKGTLQTKLATSEPTIQDVELHQDLPDVVRFGVQVRPLRDWEFRGFMDLSRWSAFKQQCLGEVSKPCELNDDGSPAEGSDVRQNIPRHWKDAWGAKVGASYYVNEPLELMFGLGYDGNAIPDQALDPALMDFHDLSATIGGRYHLLDPLFVALNVSQIFYFSRDTNGKSTNARWQVPSRSPDAGGKYEQAITVINANLEMVF